MVNEATIERAHDSSSELCGDNSWQSSVTRLRQGRASACALRDAMPSWMLALSALYRLPNLRMPHDATTTGTIRRFACEL
jgi:hypothetical protein